MSLLRQYKETPLRQWRYLSPWGDIHILLYRLCLKQCAWFDHHSWKWSEQWGTPDMPHDYIPARVICKRCGVWKYQDDGRVL